MSENENEEELFATNYIRSFFVPHIIWMWLLGIVVLCSSLAAHEILHPEDGTLTLFLTHLGRDTAIALLVAAFISVSVERAQREKLVQMLDSKTETLIETVFKGVFNAELPQEQVSEAINLTLKTPRIRKGMSVSYTLSKQTEPEDQIEYIELGAIAEFEIQNVSSQIVTHNHELALPNPMIPSLKKHVKIHSYTVNGIEYNTKESNEKLQGALNNDDHRFGSVFIFNQELSPGQTITVKAAYCMVKELDDTEFIRTLLPADGIDLRVVDQSGIDLMLHGYAVHRDKDPKLEPEPGQQNVYRLVHKGYFLPQQGVQFWWKRRDQRGTSNSDGA